MIRIQGGGPQDARVMVIGEFPSVEDEKKGFPLSGQQGETLSLMLHEAGFLRSELYITTLCKFRPYASKVSYIATNTKKEFEYIPDYQMHNGYACHPEFLADAKKTLYEIEELDPHLIITLGELPFWYLTGEESVYKWRGSQMRSITGHKLIPTFAPDQIQRSWEWRPWAVRDLSRAFKESASRDYQPLNYKFYINPSFEEAKNHLITLQVWLDRCESQLPIACDIETIARHIACIGFAWSKTHAICIPFMDKDGRSFYAEEEEFTLIEMILAILMHPKLKLIGQNFSYDTQHIVRSWGHRPRIGFDTMLAQHVLFPGIPKDLGFLASMYCENYTYWKDELDDYKQMPEDVIKFWTYNCKDNVNTYEIAEVLCFLVKKLGFTEQFDFLQNLNHHVITMMIRGCRQNQKMKGELAIELLNALGERQQAINDMVSQELNISSPKQMQTLFYKDFGQKPIHNRKTHQVTTDASAMQTIAQREPILQPLCSLIEETRSIGVFLSTFIQMPLDVDQRMRCSFNVGGTETFRFSSSKNAFGSGGNLQNIPKGNEEDDDLAPDAFIFPNVRRLFVPDPGMTLFDVDLAGADAQVVAWEAEDEDLKAKFRSGAKIHALNSKDIYGAQAGLDGKRQPYYKKAKMGCHLCLADDHEVLTRQGWVSVQTVTTEEEIVVCSMDGLYAGFERPSAWYHAQDSLEMLEISGQAYHQLVTPNHKLSYATDRKGVVRWAEARHLPSTARLPKAVYFSGEVEVNPDLLRLLSAFHADGTIAKKQVRFHFAKLRKIDRLRALLIRLGQEIDLRIYADGTTNIFISGVLADWLISQGKTPSWKMLQWSRKCLQAYVDELPFWDGCISKTSVSFSTVNPLTAEIIHTLVHLCGAAGNTYPVGNCGGYTVQINNRPLHRLASGTVKRVPYTGGLHCPTVSTGFFLTRYKGKIAITGNTNYGGRPPTLAKALGMTIKEAEWFQHRWFDMHPGIKTWHEETLNSLMTTRSVRNKFGFRRFYFDRLDGLLPEALAWIPQSTVAIVINKGLVRIAESKTSLELILQVHDSLVGQFPTREKETLVPILRECLRIPVPYSDPLVIGTSLDLSEVSWGDLTAY